MIVYTISECHGLQVCLDYWNSLVSELFDSNHNLDSPAGVAHMMGLQVEMIFSVPLKHFEYSVFLFMGIMLIIVPVNTVSFVK